MKFNEASQVFPCIEIDLVLDTSAQQVYVFHPPKANNFLTLKDLISHQSASLSKLWLNTKNLDKSNAEFYLQYLNQVFVPANRSGILIETSMGAYDDTQLRSLLATFRNSSYSLIGLLFTHGRWYPMFPIACCAWMRRVYRSRGGDYFQPAI